MARAPLPGSARKDSPALTGSPRSRAAATIARATGCSEPSSTAAAIRRSSPSSSPTAAATRESSIRPVVTVPVLSRTIVSTRRVCSSTSGPAISIPSCEPRPVPTSSAVGVASPSAHGQAMMSVATAAVKAISGPAPSRSQPASVRRERAKTIGTKTAETRSARRCTCALPVWAFSTRRPILASSVSAPTRVTSTTIRPPTLRVAPTTRSPAETSTGVDSPVSMLASTAEAPSTTIPSVATFSPGRTTKRSPMTSAPIGTCVSAPSRTSTASFAPSSSSALNAAPDARFARASM